MTYHPCPGFVFSLFEWDIKWMNKNCGKLEVLAKPLASATLKIFSKSISRKQSWWKVKYLTFSISLVSYSKKWWFWEKKRDRHRYQNTLFTSQWWSAEFPTIYYSDFLRCWDWFVTAPVHLTIIVLHISCLVHYLNCKNDYHCLLWKCRIHSGSVAVGVSV